ncbi:7935_t:CDS:1, partial [Dentiscutata heterogama]
QPRLNCPEQYINELWDTISNSIKRAANKSIPRKRVYNFGNENRYKRKETKLHKDTTKLSKIIQDFKKKGTICEVEEAEIKKVNKLVEHINNTYMMSLDKLTSNSTLLHEWLIAAKQGWKAMRVLERAAENSSTCTKIKEAVNQRLERIDGDVGRMLASILERSYKKINIDR